MKFWLKALMILSLLAGALSDACAGEVFVSADENQIHAAVDHDSGFHFTADHGDRLPFVIQDMLAQDSDSGISLSKNLLLPVFSLRNQQHHKIFNYSDKSGTTGFLTVRYIYMLENIRI